MREVYGQMHIYMSAANNEWTMYRGKKALEMAFLSNHLKDMLQAPCHGYILDIQV